jgi:hypothetical protein
MGLATSDWTQDNPATLLRQADEALYKAKQSGRDAIGIYDSSRRGPTVAVASGTPVGRCE